MNEEAAGPGGSPRSHQCSVPSHDDVERQLRALEHKQGGRIVRLGDSAVWGLRLLALSAQAPQPFAGRFRAQAERIARGNHVTV